MDTKIVKVNETNSMETADGILHAGGVIAFPTDTVYGVGCLVNNANAIARIYAIKERDRLKAIPVLIGDTQQMDAICAKIPETARKLASAFWPGALTIILGKKRTLPSELTLYDTVGVRMPDHAWLRELIRNCGPLAVTSANISGQPSLDSADDVLQSLNGRIDLLVDGGICAGGVPSTVVDCTKTPFEILREGAISRDVLQSVA